MEIPIQTTISVFHIPTLIQHSKEQIHLQITIFFKSKILKYSFQLLIHCNELKKYFLRKLENAEVNAKEFLKINTACSTNSSLFHVNIQSFFRPWLIYNESGKSINLVS